MVALVGSVLACLEKSLQVLLDPNVPSNKNSLRYRGAKIDLMGMMKHPIDMECERQSLLYGAARNEYEIARFSMEFYLPDGRSPNVKVLGPNLRDKCDLTPLYDAN